MVRSPGVGLSDYSTTADLQGTATQDRLAAGGHGAGYGCSAEMQKPVDEEEETLANGVLGNLQSALMLLLLLLFLQGSLVAAVLLEPGRLEGRCSSICSDRIQDQPAIVVLFGGG